MQFRQDASVFTANGEDLGRLDRVVLDPGKGEVTHLVVRKGWFFTQDRVVPVELIERAEEDEIRLKPDVDDPDSLPVFEETHYVGADEEALRRMEATPPNVPPLYWYPPLSVPVGFPAYYRMPFSVETERNVPEGAVALKDGAKVLSAEGKQAGTVERIFAEEESGRATHILVSHGLLGAGKKLIPTLWITSVEEDEVHLAVRSEFLDRIPEYKA